MRRYTNMRAGGRRRGQWFGRVVAVLLLGTGALVATLLISGTAEAASKHNDNNQATTTVGSGATAEITATVVAGVLIVGAAGGVLWYTAYNREDPRNVR